MRGPGTVLEPRALDLSLGTGMHEAALEGKVQSKRGNCRHLAAGSSEPGVLYVQLREPHHNPTG